MTPSSVSTSISSSGAFVIAPRLVPSAYVIGTSTPTARIARTVRCGVLALTLTVMESSSRTRFFAARPSAGLAGVIGRRLARTLPQRLLQIRRALVLLQQVGEGFVRQILEILHAVARQEVDGGPGVVIELNALAGHRSFSSSGNP